MDPITPRAQRGGRTQDPNTPQRRSLYDLQKLIDEVFDGFAKDADTDDDGRTCRAADLPAILSAFEEKRDLILLDDGEKEMLRAFTEQHPDLDVSSEQLVSLLSAMTADNRAESQSPPSPTRVYDKQLPTPPTSNDDEHSQQDDSRSRSSSHSSRSSSSRNSTMLTGSGTLEDSITSPSLFDTDPIFPRSHSMPEGVVQQLASPPGTPIASAHQRSHTSNDLARIASSSSSTGSGIPRPISSAQHARTKSGMSTPLSATITARQRSSPLVDMQAEQALRRSRPAPPKSRRQSGDRFAGGNLPSSNSTGSIASLDGRRSRQSSDEFAISPRIMSPNDGLTSPLFATSLDAMHEEDTADSSFDDVYARPRSRQTSGMRGASPLFETSPPPHASMQGAMFPPQSPLLDDTSFHTIPISPHELRNTMDDFRGNSNEHEPHILHTRPVSTVSIGSEVTALQELVQTLQQELAKKNQDLEAQRSDSYSLLMEKESILEEIKIELISKRKEEKELRSKEKINLNQIATLEAQTASFRDERDKQKMAYQNARKQYEEQCNESEKLRNVIRSKDEDLRAADENLQNANSDLVKITRERDYLQSQVSRLEEEISEAKLSIDLLEESKNENLQLKETIDRLRLDLDELRTQARSHSEMKTGGTALSRSASGTESIPPTLSRNLCRELARKFAGQGMEESAETEETNAGMEGDDGYEEEIVTTRRRLKRPLTKKGGEASTSTESGTAPMQETLSLEVCDVQIQVSPPEIQTTDAETQTEEERELTQEEKRNALARDLAVNLDAVEEYLRVKEERAKLHAAEPDTAPPPYQSGPHVSPNRHGIFQPYTTVLSREAKSIFGYARQSTNSLLAYTFMVFLSGLFAGSNMFPIRHYHHFSSPDASWAAYNTLEMSYGGHASSWGENLRFIIERLIWKGVEISRRVPT